MATNTAPFARVPVGLIGTLGKPGTPDINGFDAVLQPVLPVYRPKISDDLIPRIYRLGKAERKPMTRVVDEILRDYLDWIEIGEQERVARDRGVERRCLVEMNG